MENLRRRKEDRLPWFPFNTDRWETDLKVRQMGPATRGIFLTLLVLQWREGSIPSDPLTLLRLICMPPDPVRSRLNDIDNKDGWMVDLEACLEMVLECFVPDGNGGLINETLEQIRAEQNEFRARKAQAGRVGGLTKKQNSSRSVAVLQSCYDDASDLLVAEGKQNVAIKNKNEIKNKDLTSLPKRATRLPEEFIPSEEHYQLGRQLGINTDMEFQKFRDYFLGVPGGKGVKLDWNATLRNWLRNSLNYKGVSSDGHKTTAQLRNERASSALDRAFGEEETSRDVPAAFQQRAGRS